MAAACPAAGVPCTAASSALSQMLPGQGWGDQVGRAAHWVSGRLAAGVFQLSDSCSLLPTNTETCSQRQLGYKFFFVLSSVLRFPACIQITAVIDSVGQRDIMAKSPADLESSGKKAIPVEFSI